jgi:hypothetical protein
MNSSTVPSYQGLQHIDGLLPLEIESWPKFSNAATLEAAGDDYDIARDQLRKYGAGKPWIWPERTIFFLCDIHADTDAFFTSLVASGGIEKTGPGDENFELTDEGRAGVFVIGGDCFDKGPENLRLIRAIGALIARGAEVDLLAGNHDVRALVGFVYLGRREPRLAHLFVRMGKKSVPLFKEIYESYILGTAADGDFLDDDEVRRRYFPQPSWYEDFPRAVSGLILPAKVEKEIARIREKVGELEARCLEAGMTLGQILAAAQKCRELFVEPTGEFAWFFERMRLARRAGSFLFLHAGVDDAMAAVLADEGVEGLNAQFARLADEDLFSLYNGAVGNTFRTKYRDSDLPLTPDGVRNMHRAGLYAIVHGHRNITRGQRMVMRSGILNFECDSSVDRNTRKVEGLQGSGGAATVFRPSGSVLGISTDYAYVKHFNASQVLEMTTIVNS